MLQWVKRGALVVLLLIVAAFGTGWWLLHGSVATMDGTRPLAGLSAPVRIERDALGVVTIHAANEIDAMRALGYVHAQEHFFEMDLLRRSAAGELSELFGGVALDLDKGRRVHRLRARLRDGQLATFAGNAMPQLKAYTEGVNAGLAGLNVRPWPYLLLRSQPAPWLAEDSALAVDAMYFDLQGGNNKDELTLWRIRQSVPPALFALISSDGTQWDAPLQGRPRGNVALPDAATLDLRTLPAPGIDGNPPYVDADKPGSNNFAVSGALTADGRAILANDMHLGLRVPNIWFRVRLLYQDAQSPGGQVDISGFTLPGVPDVVVGSNTHVAWGFTNSYGDWMDWVEDCAPTDTACDTAEKTLHETIRVKGAKSFDLKVVETAFGTRIPDITGPDAKLSLAWTAHRPGALTMGLGAMATVTTTASAVGVLSHAGIPAQNAMIVDSQGHIAWTIAGRMPDKRADFGCNRAAPSRIPPTSAPKPEAPSLPATAADSLCAPWNAWTDSNPSIIDPPSHRLWTANNRVSDAADLAAIGDSGYDLGARAKQIRDDLFAKERFNERDLLAIQLDDRALFLQRWWHQLRALVQGSNDPALRRIEAATRQWNPRASTDAVSYRIVRAWRAAVLSRVQDGLLAPAEVKLGKDFHMPRLSQLEGVAWESITQRPANLLPRKFWKCAANGPQGDCAQAGWSALLTDAAHDAGATLGKIGPLAKRNWGERNTAAICHPLAAALPGPLHSLLCMPADQLRGDSNMPRVAGPDFGASERMVVSPGHEIDGIIEMPAGQSGNPLSPFWGAGHDAWVQGKPTPFLPGKRVHVLTLVP